MMTLICMVGLPRSGKTTFIKSYTQGKEPIVSPDAIRYALHGQRFVSEAEDFVWAIAKVMVRSLFLAGINRVWIDATNTTKKRRDFWRDENWKTLFYQVKTSKEVCLERAKAEKDLLIIPVIERMSQQFEPLEDQEIWEPIPTSDCDNCSI